MKIDKIYIALFSVLMMIFLSSPGVAAASTQDTVELQEIQQGCTTTTLMNGDGHSPFSSRGPYEGGAGATYIDRGDIVPHASVTAVNSLTLAVIIGVLNTEGCDQPVYKDPVPRHTVFHRILFRSLISPNAP